MGYTGTLLLWRVLEGSLAWGGERLFVVVVVCRVSAVDVKDS